MQEVKSSNIHSIGFENGTLKIRFLDKEGKPGALYHYENVPEQVHRDLMAAPSYGKHFGANIRHLYRGVKQ